MAREKVVAEETRICIVCGRKYPAKPGERKSCMNCNVLLKTQAEIDQIKAKKKK